MYRCCIEVTDVLWQSLIAAHSLCDQYCRSDACESSHLCTYYCIAGIFRGVKFWSAVPVGGNIRYTKPHPLYAWSRNGLLLRSRSYGTRLYITGIKRSGLLKLANKAILGAS